MTIAVAQNQREIEAGWTLVRTVAGSAASCSMVRATHLNKAHDPFHSSTKSVLIITHCLRLNVPRRVNHEDLRSHRPTFRRNWRCSRMAVPRDGSESEECRLWVRLSHSDRSTNVGSDQLKLTKLFGPRSANSGL
jgi:hypothetical protein